MAYLSLIFYDKAHFNAVCIANEYLMSFIIIIIKKSVCGILNQSKAFLIQPRKSVEKH